MWADLEFVLAVIGGWFLVAVVGTYLWVLNRKAREQPMDQQQLALDERRPPLYALTVPCMKCGALIGHHCTTETGAYAVESHKVRKRQAAMKQAS